MAVAQLAPGFTASVDSGCGPLTVEFNDATSGGSVAAHSWSYVLHTASGSTSVVFSSSANPVYTFSVSGYYDVIETVTDGSGATYSADSTNYVKVFQPNVSFTPTVPLDSVSYCPGKSVTFSNTTTDTGCLDQYKWAFSNTATGANSVVYTTGTGTNVSYTFSTSGTYDISLFETNGSGCSCSGHITYSGFIKIDSLPVVSFTNDNPTPCGPPAVVNFNSDATTGAVTYLWHFGGGGTSTLADPPHTYTAAGTFSDTLTAYTAAGCPIRVRNASDVKVGTFVPHIRVYGNLPLCNLAYAFTDSTPTKTNFYIHDLDNTFFANNTYVVNTFTAPGTYTIIDSVWSTVTGCAAVATHVYTLYPTPIVSFSATPTYRCTPNDTVAFTSIITDAAGIDSLVWSFGDAAASGHFDTAHTDSVHIYTTPGLFSPRLYIKDNNGCVAIDSTQTNYINIEPPAMTIVPAQDSGCVPFTACFTTSIAPSGVPFITDSVNFGDATTHCVGNNCGDTCHTYTMGGTFKIKHYYHLTPGCSYADSINVVAGGVAPIMHSYVTADTVCPNTEVYFKDSCANCTSFFWNLNNKTSTSLTIDSTKYTTLGYKAITAIGDVGGCTDTIPKYVYVLPPLANAVASIANCDSNNIIHFAPSGSSGASSYFWSFGDGTFSSQSAPTHTYTVASEGASYPVILMDSAAGIHHCTNRDTINVNIYPVVDTFHASDTSVCRLTNVLFTGPVSQSGSNYYRYVWTFLSSGTVPETDSTTSRTLNHSFADTGIYTVQLVVINQYGCRSSSIIKTGYIHVTGPIGGISVTTPIFNCTRDSVHLHDNNIVVAGSFIVSRQWQFSGPTSIAGVPIALYHSSGADTFYNYPEGSFRIALIDSDNNGCFSYDTVRVYSQKPHAYFTANSTIACKGVPVTFTDTNTHCTYIWSFGDGATGTGQSPTHIYSVNGVYSVSVAVETALSSYLPNGCVDTQKRIGYINVENLPVTFNFLSDSVSACPPLYVQTNATGIVTSFNYYWNIDHHAPYYPSASFSSTFNTAGLHILTLLDSNAIGCKDSLSEIVEIDGPAGIITASIDSGCTPIIGVNLQFIDTFGIAVPNYTWVTGDDSVYNGLDTSGISHTYTATGHFLPYVIISSPGCAATIYSTDTINVFPLPATTVTHPGVVCFGAGITLATGASNSGDTYYWSPGYALSCNTCLSVFATPTVTTTYTVTQTNLHGCVDTAIANVVVDSLLKVTIIGKDSVCLGQCDTLYAYGIDGNYLWTPDTALSSNTHDTAIACSFYSRIYTVVATDNRGCSADTTFAINIKPLPEITISPSPLFVCQDATTQLFASGAGPGGTYAWSPDVLISNTAVYNPVVSDTANFTYKVVGTTAFGCVDSINVFVAFYDSTITTISNDTTICKGRSVPLIATSSAAGNPATFLWSPPQTLNYDTISYPAATPDTTTTYTVTIKENPCFTVSRQVTVTVENNPVINVTNNGTIVAGSSVQLFAIAAASDTIANWAWTPSATLSCDNCFDPVATPVNNTTYTVFGTTPIGCVGQGEVQLNLTCIEATQVFVPNTFTPNGDGSNDRFYLSGRGLGLISTMRVYNRWGEKVFEAHDINANDPSAGWDGTYKGQILSPDVFVYVFELFCETGAPFTLKGDISLVR